MKRIAVFTATRAEYGLLSPVLKAISAHGGFDAGLIVAGAHLDAAHGATVAEIEADGSNIWARVPTPADGTALDAARIMAATTEGVAEALDRLRPDALMLLGDRSEALAAAGAATVMRVPVIHLEGGHTTGGAIDDNIRHAVTKLAGLHFTAREAYRDRIIGMGEAPDRVFAVGSTGADNLLAAERATVDQVSAMLDTALRPGFLLVTLHPETLSDIPPERQAAILLKALDALPDAQVIFTLPNADAGGAVIREAILAWTEANAHCAHAFASLGRDRYAAALTACGAVVGNSSSGVIEAPIVGTPTVNIGERQAGRLRSPSILDVSWDADEIAGAVRRALDPAFRREARPDPLDDGRAAARIVEVLARTDLSGLERKG